MIHSQVTGKGTPVLLLHGFCEDLTLWDALVPVLSESHQIITLDLPGFGQSSPLTNPITVDEVAKKIHEHLTEQLNLRHFIVLGHSLGGYVSLALAENYPDTVQALGLINSTSFADADDKKQLREKTVGFIEKHGVRHFLTGFVDNLFTDQFKETGHDVLEKVLQMGLGLPTEVVTGYMLAMRDRPDRSGLLRERACFFLGGKEDPHVPLADSQKQLRMLINKDNGHLLEKVAHMSMFEAPLLLEKAIKSFILSLKM